MYCRDHDEVICTICVSMQHRSCDAVIYIPDEVQNLLKAITLETVKTGLSTTIATLENDKKSAEVSLNRLSNKRNPFFKSVENHGLILKAIIDDLVNESKREIDEQYHIIEEKIKKKVEKIVEDLAELDKSTKHIEHVEKQKNDAQLFVAMKRCQARMTESQKNHADFTKWTKTVNFKYNLNKEIEESLKRFKLMGSVNVQHTKPSLYTVRGQREVRVCQEGTSCHITSSCQLLDGSFLLTDMSHEKIVHLDTSCDKITDQSPVPGTPYAVCLIGDKEAAVSLWNCQIQFVSVGTEMTLTRSLMLQHVCRGLAFSLGELFVSNSGNEVFVYDTVGNHLRTLENISPEKGKIVRGTDHITVSCDGQRVYVSHCSMGIVCMGRDGKQLFKNMDYQLQGARGIQTNDSGSILVCGYNSNNIIQLTDDGQKLGVLLNTSNRINTPVSVCFDSRGKNLLVSKDNDSSISIYELE